MKFIIPLLDILFNYVTPRDTPLKTPPTLWYNHGGQIHTLDYTDAGDISDWAADAMAWAVSTGVITGYPNGTVNPGCHATRAELAVMIHR